MPKFVFQLEGVLKHRRNIERERRRPLALAQAKLHQLQSELRELDQSVQSANADARQHHLVGRLDMGFIAAHRRYIAATQRQAVALAQKMALAQREIDQARAALAEAAKQRKIIEKLREKQFGAWREDLARKESRELDEIGAQLSARHAAEATS
jgi:flagellar FliJ protein